MTEQKNHSNHTNNFQFPVYVSDLSSVACFKIISMSWHFKLMIKGYIKSTCYLLMNFVETQICIIYLQCWMVQMENFNILTSIWETLNKNRINVIFFSARLSPPLHHPPHRSLPRNRSGSWSKENKGEGPLSLPVKLRCWWKHRQGTGPQWGITEAWTWVQRVFASFFSLLPLVSQPGTHGRRPLEPKRVCLV